MVINLLSLSALHGCTAGTFVPVRPDSDAADEDHLMVTPGPSSTSAGTTSEPVTDPCAGDPRCVDAAQVEVRWRLDPGWSKYDAPRRLGDLNGDSQEDLAWVLTYGVSVETVIVFGPVERDVSVPSGADARIVGAVLESGDATGDGILDVLAHTLDSSGYNLYLLFQGPISGMMTPYTEGVSSWGGLLDFDDINGDGVLDLIDVGNDGFEMWSGPAANWRMGEPTLELVDNDCYAADPPMAGAYLWTDLDGDSVVDVCASHHCGNFVLPSNVIGVLDLGDVPSTPVMSCPSPIGDQTGDGIVDYYGGGSRTWAGPLSFGSDGSIQSGTAIVPGDRSGIGIPFDFNSDRFPELASLKGRDTRIYTGGPDGGYVAGEHTVRLAAASDGSASLHWEPILENGNLLTPVSTADGVGFANLGPAETVALQ